MQVWLSRSRSSCWWPAPCSQHNCNPPPTCSALSTAATVGGYGPGKFSAATTANTEIDGLYAKSDGTAVFSAPDGGVSVLVQDSARPNPTILG